MTRAAPWLACAGCARAVDADDPLPFRCAAAAPGDDIDHVIARPAPPAALPAGARWPDDDNDNPFVRYRTLMYAWQRARARGLPDQEYLALVRDLDAAVADIDGHGFQITPCAPAPALASDLGLARGQVWVKDETGQVGGSHKARHLMGLAIYLAVAERLGALPGGLAGRELAIASCGNAALAAAIVARAAHRPLRVFIPTWADPSVVARMRALGATLEVCDRQPDDAPGDPCYARFRAAVDAGALPFTCQGNENGLTIDGGMTLAWELVDQLAATPSDPMIDRLVVQVGGGALASACAQGLSLAHALGALERMPVIHAVQSQAVHPLVRAWRVIIDRARGRGALPRLDAADDRARVAWQREPENATALAAELERAAHRRSDYMWPVEHPEHSAADGILDDETYDWLAVMRAMFATRGWPLTVPETLIEHASERARAATGIRVSATGSAGLAGAFALHRAGELRADEHLAILFTGVMR